MTAHDLAAWQHDHDHAHDHEIADLHVWRIGPASRACILSLVSHAPLTVDRYRQLLAGIAGLDHVTIEINQCRRCGAA